MRKLFKAAAVALVMVLSSCGGGGGGDSSSSSVNPNLLYGTWTVTGFTITSSNGITITEKDVTSWAGTLKIYPDDYIYQWLYIDGENMYNEGYTVIVWKNSVSGDIYGAANKWLASFSINGNAMTLYLGVQPIEGTDITFEEWDYFVKTSSTAGPESLSPNSNKEMEHMGIGVIK